MASTYEATEETVEETPRDAKNESDASATVEVPTAKATSALENLHPIPGLEVVGRGIYLRPRQPYQLKDVLAERKIERSIYCTDTSQSYRIPEGYEVNDSPPMPTNQTVNQTVIEETWESFETHLVLDVKVAAGIGPFSLKADTVEMSRVQASENAFYAMRTSFIPLWTVYLPTVPDLSTLAEGIPEEFQPEDRAVFEKFFQRHGTHFVRRAWVGGTATLAFTIYASAELQAKDIRAGITAGYGALGAAGSKDENDSRTNVLKNSQFSVWGKGGNESQLATLNSLDHDSYSEWLSSIKDNPVAIELEVVGMWTLIEDEKKATALRNAYRAAYQFTPITAVFAYPLGGDDLVYFIRGNEFFLYTEGVGTSTPMPLQTDFQWIDAAFAAHLLPSAKDAAEDLFATEFFFSRNQYLRFQDNKSCEDARMDGTTRPAGPTSIAEGWPGVPFDSIDAVLNAGPESIYFFKGDQYIRFNWLKNMAEGEPKAIRRRWAGVTFDRIDAAIYRKNSKAYFFRGDRYIVYDMVTYRADPGYPKFLPGSYIEDWKIFD